LVKLVRASFLTLTLLLSACASSPSKTTPILPDHCDVTAQYAEVSTVQLQHSLQQDKETRGITASYDIDLCRLLNDPNKALSVLTVETRRDDFMIGELGLAVFLVKTQQGWGVVDFTILYAESYESKKTNTNKNKKEPINIHGDLR